MAFQETLTKVIGLVYCLSLVRGQEALFCEDQGLTQPAAINPLAEFSSYHHHHLRVSDKLSFRPLSVKECAQLCLQVTRKQMFNCSSFEHVTDTSDCLLMAFSCQNNILSLDSSTDFYQLKGSNGAISCETFSSSSVVITTVSSSFIHTTSSIYSTPAVTSAEAYTRPTHNIHTESLASFIVANNKTSATSYPTATIHSVSSASSITADNMSSGFTQATITIYPESVASSVTANNESSGFAQPTAIVHTESAGSSIASSNNSTVVGKPPSGLNVTIVSPTTLRLSWSPGDIQQLINLWGFRVAYRIIGSNETNGIVVDKHRTSVNISGLLSDSTYIIWVMSLTAKGFGVPSKALNVTTPSQGTQGIVITLTVLLINNTWDAQFENDSSGAFKNLSSVIEHSMRGIHPGNSTYKNMSNLRFSNHRNGTVAFINASYDRSSRMENLYGLYEALYKDKMLQDLPIKVFHENVPGKPPMNITSLALRSSSIAVKWDLPQSNHCGVFPLRGYRVFYALSNIDNATRSHSIDVNSSTDHVVIQHLENFQYYLIWLQTITTRGLGPPSKAMKIRTIEKVVSVNLTLHLDVPWVQALLNNTSHSFASLSKRIERNVYVLYESNFQLRRVVSETFRNESGNVTAEIDVTFGQHVKMSAFIRLYESLHTNGTLGNMTVSVISDNIPGKPPRNLSVDVISTTSVLIGWEFPSTLYEPSIPTTAVRIFYKLQGNMTAVNFKDTNVTTGYFVLDNLEKFTWYTVWVKSDTSRGLGVESERFRIRTLEEVVPINATVRLPDEEWRDDLSNTTSEAFMNLSRKLEINVIDLYLNDTHLRRVMSHHFRNDSGKVVADVEIIFGQHVEMELFMTLYQALYRNGSVGELSVEPIWDNIPGKPPSNISAHATSTTSVRLKWNSIQDVSNILLLRIFNVAANQQNGTISKTDVNASINSVAIGNLGKFVIYTVWVRSVTRRGLGTASLPIYIRTLEEVVPVNMTVRLNNLKWSINLSNPESEDFKNLTRTIQQNVQVMYGQESNYIREVQCHGFRNGSVLADVTIVYAQNVGPQQFSVIYKALYEDGRLGNLSVQPVNDNVPGKPPTNVSVESTTSTAIQVTWLCADCHQHNSTIGFLISYKLDSSNQTVATVVNRTARQFLISALKKFTNYTIHVSSVTARGIGVASKQVSVRTLEDVPSHAPVNLRAHNMSSTSLLVAWEPLPGDHVNGILLGYKVAYKKQGGIHENRQNTSTTLNFTVLSGLEKFTAFEVTVSAFTRIGDGPAANVTASTDEDVPSLPPADIQSHNTSSTSLMVTWNPVPKGFTHGIVLGYLVLYKKEKDSHYSYANKTSLVNSAELTNLDKFTMYVVKVLAFTIKGNGELSNKTLVRTHEDVPSLPPTQLSAYNTSSTSLMVTWLPVPDGHVHGVLRGYRLLFKKEQGTFYKNMTTVNQSLELTGLEKFTNYSVKVLAFTRIGDGNVSDPVTVSTDQDVPSLPPQNLSSYNTSSTSLHVSWHEVPRGFVHGILLGYRVLYKIASGSRNNSIATTSQTTRQTELQGLKKFTIYEISVLAFTAIGDGANSTRIFVSTDEDIPSRPPVDLTARNTSSTSIQVMWGEVPQGFVHGILQGYRVFYKRTGDKNNSYVNVTTGPTTRELHVTGLKKFTEYSTKVLAFTVKGDGAVSLNISVLTDEDVPSLPPQSVQSYNTSSTGVNVTWHEVPTGFVHGILRGYRVFYSRTKDNGANVRQAAVPVNKRHVHLTGLDKFTNYTIQVAAFTRIGYGAKSPGVIVSTDEDVPSLPPQNLWANNISSTALRTKWDPVPPGFVHGILRGYRVLYRKTNEPSTQFTKITVPPEVRLSEIYDLMKFTFYTIRVLAFTIKGDGAESPPLNVTTDEDIPSEQPQNVYAGDKTSAIEISLSWQPPPDHAIHGILKGFYIWYSIIQLGIHEKNPVFPQDFRMKQLPAASYQDTLTNLESYARYSIRIAAFTSKGYGPIREISTRTCRCRSVIPTNWWNNPPYATIQPHSNSSKAGGIIPITLKDIVTHCCQSCAEFGTTNIDFTTDANGLKAEKDGVIQVKDAISTKTMISFGIAGVMPQEKYHSPDGEVEYVPIMETPGVAFIVAEKRDIHKEVLLAILSCWPAVVIAVIMTYLAGIVVWALDMNWNHVDFPQSFFSGSLEGLWWSFVTMTTVGYGDRIPKSIPARLFAFLWTWIGIVTIAVITSSITASLMSMVFQPEKMLYGTKLAAIANSTEYKLGLRRNAKLDAGRSYGNLYDIYDDLQNDRVHAALLDSYSTASESELFSKAWIRVIEVIPVRYESANGLVLTGDAMKLARCFRSYVRRETSDIHRIIQKHVGSIKADDVPFAVKTSSELLTEESYLYVRTVIILGGALGAFTLFGLLFHYCFYKKSLSTHSSESREEIVVVTSSGPPITRSETIKQLKQDIAEFYDMFKKRYLALRGKHIKELQKLRRLTNGSTDLKRLPDFTANRRGHYEITKDNDVNSIFEGMEFSMFDKRSSQRWRL